jgi:hypothetical protein
MAYNMCRVFSRVDLTPDPSPYLERGAEIEEMWVITE